MGKESCKVLWWWRHWWRWRYVPYDCCVISWLDLHFCECKDCTCLQFQSVAVSRDCTCCKTSSVNHSRDLAILAMVWSGFGSVVAR
jgi:hypothetical protein